MTTYRYQPNNFADIEHYFITDQNIAVLEMIRASTVFFYDTCSIMHHAHLMDVNPIVSYVKNNNGIVVIARTVVMELSSPANGNIIQEQHMQYIGKLYDAGIKIFLFNEESSLNCINIAFSCSVEEINQMLGYEVMQMKTYKGAISRYYDRLPEESQRKLRGQTQSSSDEFLHFFQSMRSYKETEDSLAEELIMLIFILVQECLNRLVLISDDSRCSNKFLQTTQYIKQHYQRGDIHIQSTASLCLKLYRDGLLQQEGIERFLLSAYQSHQSIRLFVATKEDIEISERQFSLTELVELIKSDSELRIYR